MKYIVVFDDEYVPSFRLEKGDFADVTIFDDRMQMKLMKRYETQLKAIRRPMMILPDGDSLFLSDEEIDCLIKFEEERVKKNFIERIIKSFGGLKDD